MRHLDAHLLLPVTAFCRLGGMELTNLGGEYALNFVLRHHRLIPEEQRAQDACAMGKPHRVFGRLLGLQSSRPEAEGCFQ